MDNMINTVSNIDDDNASKEDSKEDSKGDSNNDTIQLDIRGIDDTDSIRVKCWFDNVI